MNDITKDSVTTLTDSILVLAGTLLAMDEKLMVDKGIEELSHTQTFQMFAWLTDAEYYMKKAISSICQSRNLDIPYYGYGVKTHRDINEVLLELISDVRKVLDLVDSASFSDNVEFIKLMRSAFDRLGKSQIFNTACLVQRTKTGE